MRKQDRIAQQQHQPPQPDHGQHPPKPEPESAPREPEQIKGASGTPRPQRSGGRLPLPD
jgi:hypothetical protein